MCVKGGSWKVTMRALLQHITYSSTHPHLFLSLCNMTHLLSSCPTSLTDVLLSQLLPQRRLNSSLFVMRIGCLQWQAERIDKRRREQRIWPKRFQYKLLRCVSGWYLQYQSTHCCCSGRTSWKQPFSALSYVRRKLQISRGSAMRYIYI